MFKQVSFTLSFWVVAMAAQAADEPQWLKEARAREGKPIVAREFKSKDNWLKAKVPGKVVGVIEKVQGSYSIELDIGATDSVYCELYPDGVDIADTLRRMLDATLEQIEKVQGKIDIRTLDKIDAGALGHSPYLMPSWVYRVGDGDAKHLGGIKQFAMEKDGRAVYCAHTEIGYTKTFAAVANAFAETLETAEKPVPPYYREIGTMTLNGMTVGVTHATLVRDADGDTKAVITSAMLMPQANGVVHSQDVAHVEWMRPDASLINATYIIVGDGEIKSDLALKAADEQWSIDGTSSGKPVNTKLNAGALPGTWIGQARELRKLMAEEKPVGAEHNISLWLSDEITKLQDVKTKLVAQVDDKNFSAVSTIPGMTLNMTLDKASGMAVATSMQIFGQAVKQERVYSSGAF
ncbi:MAG TPA: hypothetical protein VGO61_07040 [Steroidobacteraceae bacterium]|jgi:hypothetical protein|nr:hypothetical protein [Steroidobacteraceae bacterium]